MLCSVSDVASESATLVCMTRINVIKVAILCVVSSLIHVDYVPNVALHNPITYLKIQSMFFPAVCSKTREDFCD